MSAKILYASVDFVKLTPDATLPAKFNRMLDKLNLEQTVKGKTVAIKMHVGRGIGYSTIHPLFVKNLVTKVQENGASRVYITDQETSGGAVRGYTREYLGCPIVDMNGETGKYFYERHADFRCLKNIDVGGHIADADVLIDLSHVKGHGTCGYGGAVKNIAMGCVTDRTRGQIHSLEGGIVWDKDKCIHCNECIVNCNHKANWFNDDSGYEVNFHNCTMCQHCVRVCPTDAIVMDTNYYKDFQTGMAIATKKCLEHFKPENILYINFLMDMTLMCDCWGFTTPSIVPDIGILAGNDIVAIEKASLDMIKTENFIPTSVPKGHQLGTSGHLLERIHGKNPYIQLEELVRLDMGCMEYELDEIV